MKRKDRKLHQLDVAMQSCKEKNKKSSIFGFRISRRTAGGRVSGRRSYDVTALRTDVRLGVPLQLPLKY